LSSLSLPCLFDGKLHRPFWVALRIIARLAGQCNRPADIRVDKMSMASLATALDEASRFVVCHEFSYLPRQSTSSVPESKPVCRESIFLS
jgi:hypothetical protein